jgi:hypothetical protein
LLSFCAAKDRRKMVITCFTNKLHREAVSHRRQRLQPTEMTDVDRHRFLKLSCWLKKQLTGTATIDASITPSLTTTTSTLPMRPYVSRMLHRIRPSSTSSPNPPGLSVLPLFAKLRY